MDSFLSKEDELSDTLNQLSDPKETIRSQAALSLGWIGNEQVVDPLINALKNDPSPKVRANAAMSLGQINSDKAKLPLIESLEDTDPFVRGIVIYSVGLMKIAEAYDSLIEILEIDLDKEARMAAAEALAQLGEEKAIKHLILAFALENEDAVKREIRAAIDYLANKFNVANIEEQIKLEEKKQITLEIREQEKKRNEILESIKKGEIEKQRKEIINNISEELPKMLEYAIHNEEISFDILCDRFGCDDFTFELALTQLLDKRIINIKINPATRSFTVFKPHSDLSEDAQEKLKLIRRKFGINW
jgi:HEAT repeat protein